VFGFGIRQLLSTPRSQLPIFIGLALVASGLIFFSQGWLERILWAALVIVFTWQAWYVGRHNRA
jgi:hypothetical protein